MAWIANFFSMILSGFQAVIDFFAHGIFDLFQQMGEYLYSFLAMAFWDICTLCVDFLDWVVNLLFGSVDFSGPVNSAWSALTSEIRNALCFFRIPNAMIVLCGALTIRF